MDTNKFTNNRIQGTGIGLRNQHLSYISKYLPSVSWFEILSDNYLDLDGIPAQRILQIREKYPLTMHGVGLSLGSAEFPNKEYLRALKFLHDRIQPAWISDHICWSSLSGNHSHDLLPLAYNSTNLINLIRNIQFVQEYLQQEILVENVSSYLSYTSSNMYEWDFLNEVSNISGCKILLDINNIYVNSVNHNFSAMDYLDGISEKNVKEFHLAGFSDYGTHLIDTHSTVVHEEVWKLYQCAVKKFGKIPTLIEWDENLPNFSQLINEAAKVEEFCE